MARPQGYRLSRPAFDDILRLTGTTITAVAEASGIPRPTLSAVRGGHNRASAVMAQRIADALGVHPATLFPALLDETEDDK